VYHCLPLPAKHVLGKTWFGGIDIDIAFKDETITTNQDGPVIATQSSVSEDNVLDLELNIGIEGENEIFYDDEAILIIFLSLVLLCLLLLRASLFQ
jgi:hypothetical protein